ncbi:MAG: 30S ribosome-binding factor RbfA [Actinobacteria bacterium]|nr:30S ribosome-binding factor RbfA [Actinomycetota bacterium]
MTDLARARRLAVRIREIVATTLEQRVKDPRLGMVTIIDSRVTPDLREATIFYTVYGDDAAHAESAAALESARGVLRSEVGRQTGVRYTPTLAFVADRVQENVAHIAELIEEARAADADLARVREGAHYAGDPDPYRVEAERAEAEQAEVGVPARPPAAEDRRR